MRDDGKALPLRPDDLTVDEDAVKPRTVGELEDDHPGTHRVWKLHLAPGRYELVCNMSGHYLGGMHARAGRAVIGRPSSSFRPFATRGRTTIVAMIAMFAVFSALSVGLSIRETSRSHHRAIVVEIAGRQRTLAERYVRETMLAKAGAQADPATTGSLLRDSADSLIDGGLAPAVNGDDDETRAAGGDGPRAAPADPGAAAGERSHGHRQRVAREPPDRYGQAHARTRRSATDPERRLAVLAALTSNVSLNAARTIASGADKGISALILTQVLLGTAGLFAALLLALALTAATRRQTAHFRSLVSASTDLVLVFGEGGCRYASQAVAHMVGVPERELLEDGYAATIHPDGPRAAWPARASRASRARSSSAYATASASGGTSRRT